MREPKNILVTGGAGFIGSAFIRYLLRNDHQGKVVNYDVLTYAGNQENLKDQASDPRCKFVVGNINDRYMVDHICKDEKIDTIVHFAAESHVDNSISNPLLFVRTNVLGTATLLDVVRTRPHIHFHHVSTDEVYGSLALDRPEELFTEETPYHPNSPYSASKAASDHLVRAYAHTYNLSVTLSNCSNNYGPCQHPEKFIPLMILNMHSSHALPVYGMGLNVRDWLHVDDHARAIMEIIRSGHAGETYNVGGGRELSNLDLLNLLMEAFSRQTGASLAKLKKLVKFVSDRPGHDLRYAIDDSKLRNELKVHPQIKLENGLEQTVEWYRNNPDWVRHVRLRGGPTRCHY